MSVETLNAVAALGGVVLSWLTWAVVFVWRERRRR
jgi:hypothetical protein